MSLNPDDINWKNLPGPWPSPGGSRVLIATIDGFTVSILIVTRVVLHESSPAGFSLQANIYGDKGSLYTFKGDAQTFEEAADLGKRKVLEWLHDLAAAQL